MKCTSKIAILMATYNGEKYVAEQIDSILNQDFTDWELFIHDDGSEDKTSSILEYYQQKYPTKINIVDGKKTGCAKNNFFYLMNSIDADYIMFSDQDDYWHSDKIGKSFSEMRKLQNKNGYNVPLLVYSDLRVVDSELNEIYPSMRKYQKFSVKHGLNNLLIENIVTGCTVMINKTLLNMSKNVNDTSDIIMHDWWLALIAAKYGDMFFIKEPLIDYRQHGNNSVGTIKYNYKYVLKKIMEYASIQNSLENTRKQALAMVKFFNITDKNDVVYEYALIGYKSKIERILFYIKKGMVKSGVGRNIGLYLFG